MYVCLCNGVTDSDIRQAARAGCSGMPELTMRTGCGATCGSCVSTASEILEEVRGGLRLTTPTVSAAIGFQLISSAA